MSDDLTCMEAVEGGKPGEWIEHQQGPCPVAKDAMVDVRFQDGEISYLSRADYWYWDATGDGAIATYRVVSP